MIRKAKMDDIDHVAKIYDDILLYEEKHIKYTAFQAGVYPTKETAQKALYEDALYVYETDGDIDACIIMNRKQPEEYQTIDWKYRVSAEEVFVIHLLCVHPDRAGMGVGGELVAFATEEAKRQHGRALRLDTGGQNQPARHLYEKAGFTLAGISHMSIGGFIPHENHLFYEMHLKD